MSCPLDRLCDDPLGSFPDGQFASQEFLVRGHGDDAHLGIDIVEMLHGQLGRRHPVELGNLVQDVDGLFLLSASDEVLWRFVKVEDEEPDDKDQEGDPAEDAAADSPSIVAARGTTRFTVCDLKTSGQGRGSRRASIFGDGTERDGRGDDDTDGLPDRQEREEETTVLGQELEC